MPETKKNKISLYRRARKAFSSFNNIPILKDLFKTIDKKIREYFGKELVSINGFKVCVDKGDALRLSFGGQYEDFETLVMEKNIKTGDTVFDIGAHIGYHTLLFSRLVGDAGRVYAFEPHLDNFSLLKKNIETNKRDNVHLIQAAVSDESGNGRLRISKYSSASHSLYEPETTSKYIEIKIIKLDEYIDTKVDFIKIDAEGAEARIFKGMKNLLAKNPSLKLFIEFYPYLIDSSGVAVDEFLSELGKNFQTYEIDGGLQQLIKITPTELLRKYNVKNRKGVNLYFEPRRK